MMTLTSPTMRKERKRYVLARMVGGYYITALQATKHSETAKKQEYMCT